MRVSGLSPASEGPGAVRPPRSPSLIHQTHDEVTDCCLRAMPQSQLPEGVKGLSRETAPPPRAFLWGQGAEGLLITQEVALGVGLPGLPLPFHCSQGCPPPHNTRRPKLLLPPKVALRGPDGRAAAWPGAFLPSTPRLRSTEKPSTSSPSLQHLGDPSRSLTPVMMATLRTGARADRWPGQGGMRPGQAAPSGRLLAEA